MQPTHHEHPLSRLEFTERVRKRAEYEALTHFFTGKEGSALDGYVRTANDLLFNPEATLATVERTYEQRARSDTSGDGQTGVESQLALAQVQRVSEDIRTKAEAFEEREAVLRERLDYSAD